MRITMKKYQLFTITILTHTILSIQSSSAIDFVFNGFNSTDLSLYGNATIDESRILTLTNDTAFLIGRALYPIKIPTKFSNFSYVLPFSTSFIFAMAPNKDLDPGHGIVFLFVPYTGIDGATSSQNLGFLNRTNNAGLENPVFGVEFDVFENQEFNDISDNHVGIDENSLTSTVARDAGYYSDDGSFKSLKLNNGKNYQVWIDYADFRMNVTLIVAGMERPKQPLLSTLVNLSQWFEDEMYVGFTAATGALVQSHKILAWSFSNENFDLSKELITQGLPSFELPKDPIHRSKWFILGMVVGVFLFVVGFGIATMLLMMRIRRIKREKEEMEDWELEYWPHKISYQEIDLATKKFSEENVIGIGGNGKVYKGVLLGGAEVAVKRISLGNSEGMREFISEISSLGRLKHRNLVVLRGWCKKERGSLILVYDYMENGSLDQRIFECDENKMLNCEDRLRILKEVASALFYLHEGWEWKVLHRDIKASNVLLDKDMNARLGDFGLARMHDHSLMAATTRVVGTIGYLAPEVVKSGRVSTQTDVYGLGVLILEVMCGRRPIEDGKPNLLDWVFECMKRGELVKVLDERLRVQGGYNEAEVEKVLEVGLLCTHPEGNKRPTMRQVVKFFEGKSEIDILEGEEDMDIYLLGNARSRELWLSSSDSINNSHPTFKEMRDGISSSMSLSWSNTLAVVPGANEVGKSYVDKRTTVTTYSRRQSPE